MSNYDAHNVLFGKIAVWTMLVTHLGPDVNYGFSPLSGTFWRVVTAILAHIQPTDGRLTAPVVDVLWLASFYAPSPANATIVSLLARLDAQELNRVCRYGALVHKSASVQAHVQQLIAIACSLPTAALEKLTQIQCELVLGTDLADGECGGGDATLVLERLQFHARTMHYRHACEGMWNCHPCVLPPSLIPYTTEEQVSMIHQSSMFLTTQTYQT